MSKGIDAIRQHIQEQFERIRQQPSKLTEQDKLERLYEQALRSLEKK